MFEAGDGQDIIRQERNDDDRIGDKIIFGESVKKSDIYVRKDGEDLILENTETGDTITIKEAYKYGDGKYQIKDIRFSDGSSLTVEEIAAMIKEQEVHGTEGNDSISDLNNWYAYDDDAIIHGYAGDDTIYSNDGNDTVYGDEGDDFIAGGYGDDILYGGEGNDSLHGEWGNDTLYGGTGNDTLYGGEGDDTYVFATGDGQDIISDIYGNNRISFGEGIDVDSLLISTQNNNVAINFNDSDDMLTLVDSLRNEAYKNFELSFMDGTVGTIDLSGETDSMIHIMKEAEVQTETAVDVIAEESQIDVQVSQLVDAMNTGDGDTIGTVKNVSEINTVDETLLFVE